MTELMLSKAIGCQAEETLCFLPMIRRQKEFAYADEIGGIINLDDITHIECRGKSSWTVFRRRSAAVTIRVVCLRSAMILWTTRVMQSME